MVLGYAFPWAVSLWNSRHFFGSSPRCRFSNLKPHTALTQRWQVRRDALHVHERFSDRPQLRFSSQNLSGEGQMWRDVQKEYIYIIWEQVNAFLVYIYIYCSYTILDFHIQSILGRTNSVSGSVVHSQPPGEAPELLVNGTMHDEYVQQVS